MLKGIRSIPGGRLEDRSNWDTNDNFIPQILALVHTSKTDNPSKTHLDWIKTIADLTIVAYTDGSKLSNQRTGAGWEIYICIDNTSAIEALRFNKYNSEPARQAIKTACTLLETGWEISTVLTPSHSDILGNELADKMAKKGAENNGNECSRSFASKAWLQATVK
jgi:ribonuclease HI